MVRTHDTYCKDIALATPTGIVIVDYAALVLVRSL